MNEIDPILASVGAPVLVFDTDQKLVFINAAAKSLRLKPKTGARFSKIFPGQSSQSHFVKAVEGPDPQSFRLKKLGDENLDVFVTISAIKPKSLIVVTLLDRTPLRAAKTMRSDFVANVSHEIRSPLTAIAGFVETLIGPAGQDEAARTHFLKLMEKETARMTHLVADLLSLSKVEVKEKREIWKSADPNQVLQSAFETLRGLAEQRGKALRREGADHLPEIPGQADNLLRVMINLMENSINYSREGSEIVVAARCQDAPNLLGVPALVISVADQGDGIPSDEIPRLTERFYRVDKSRSRDMGGTGLGLAIVKHILVRHRGRLQITSEPGLGSVFTVYLPRFSDNSEKLS